MLLKLSMSDLDLMASRTSDSKQCTALLSLGRSRSKVVVTRPLLSILRISSTILSFFAAGRLHLKFELWGLFGVWWAEAAPGKLLKKSLFKLQDFNYLKTGVAYIPILKHSNSRHSKTQERHFDLRHSEIFGVKKVNLGLIICLR